MSNYTWINKSNEFTLAFNGDINLAGGPGISSVFALAYDSSASRIFAGGNYRSSAYNRFEPFVCSSTDGVSWSTDASSIWQAFGTDINLGGGGAVLALAYDSSASKIFAGGSYSSNAYGNDTPFVCSSGDVGSTWTKEVIPNAGSGGQINALVIDGPIAGGNDGSGNPIMYITRAPAPPAPPATNICFPAGTPIQTDQGIIAIDQLNPDIHTINKKSIVDITKTITYDNFLVCFKKNALGLAYPTSKTLMSKNHKVYYQGKMREAKTFIGHFEKVIKVKYTGEILYNVLMEKHSEMRINNLICETLNPNNIIAKLYTKKCKYTNAVRDNIVVLLKECLKKQDYEGYNRIVGRC